MKNRNEIAKILENTHISEVNIVYFLGAIPITVTIWKAKVCLFYRISIENENAYKQSKNWDLFNQLFLTGSQFTNLEHIDKRINSLFEFLKHRVKYRIFKKYETLYFDDFSEYFKTMSLLKEQGIVC